MSTTTSTTNRVQTSFRTSKKRNYVPTTDELNEAIEDYLHDVSPVSRAAFCHAHLGSMRKLKRDRRSHQCVPSLIHVFAPVPFVFLAIASNYCYEPQHPKASNESVRNALCKAHQSWLIPERRLKKFVKRQKQGEPMTLDDDNTLSSKKPGHRIKGFFKALGAGGGGGGVTAESTSVKKKSPVKDPEAAPSKKEEIKVVKVPVALDEPRVEPVAETTVDKSAAYVDDNDGSKGGGTCAACEGCTIL